MRFQFSTHALRCIDKAGGFDNYIINTKEKWLHSRTAIELKHLMFEVLKCKEQGMPMNQIKKEVFPKPKVSRHVYIPRTYDTRFYFDWKGPRKQVIFCWRPSISSLILWSMQYAMLFTFLKGTCNRVDFLACHYPPFPCHHFSLLLSHPKEQEEILSSPNFWAWSKICTGERRPWGWKGFALNLLRHLCGWSQKCRLTREMRIQGYICSSISLAA